jgi:hypothetical protein
MCGWMIWTRESVAMVDNGWRVQRIVLGCLLALNMFLSGNTTPDVEYISRPSVGLSSTLSK